MRVVPARVSRSGASVGAAACISLACLSGLLSPSSFFLATAYAASHRCPGDQIALGAATPPEQADIKAIWKDIHKVGGDGGDGPLGCPLHEPVTLNAPEYSWRGIGQQFQRGWILIGRDGSLGSEIALISGLASWTIWSKGLPDLILPTVDGARTDGFTEAVWTREGRVFVTPIGEVSPAGERIISLLQCQTTTTYQRAFMIVLPNWPPCAQLLPWRGAPDRPFDLAARLDQGLLTKPDLKAGTESEASAREKRIAAFFPDWLPCFTLTPYGDIGEAGFARAMIMLRRTEACPLTGIAPDVTAKAWLGSLAFPPDMFPGTDITDSECPRKGELDVTLVQLLNLALRNRAELEGPILDHIKAIVAPWGGPSRNNPYIVPHGTCRGYAIVESENHMLLQETARYLINVLTGSDTSVNRDWLRRFLQQIARRDFYEFNSIPYSRYQLKGLYALHDHAPHVEIRTLAEGILHWIFAKQAVSGNLDRDHRPYRRNHDPSFLAPRDWWGAAATPITTATALLAGPVHHGHRDIDIEFDKGKDEAGSDVITNVSEYPNFGTAPGYHTEALIDAANTSYKLTPAIEGWLVSRFTDESANRNTYLQAFNHVPKILDDPRIFLQVNTGAELVSGNRNWTIIAGGTSAPPGDPGPPPQSADTNIGYPLIGAVYGAFGGATIGVIVGGPIGAAVGAAIGAVVGLIFGAAAPDAFAASKQSEVLWRTQAGTIRPTMLIPTPVGLDRNHTIRFGRSVPTPEAPQISYLCVAEGFMCGYDLEMPTRPFPAQDAAKCIVEEVFPAALTAHFQKWVGPGKEIADILGCPKNKRDYIDIGGGTGWSIWTFERGMLALLTWSVPAPERFAGAWVEGATDIDPGKLRVAWDLVDGQYDWYRVHAYQRDVVAQLGEPPGGWIEPAPVVGDSKTTGQVTFDLRPHAEVSPTWDILIVGCAKDHVLFFEAGHTCKDHIIPKLTVFVGKLPKQPFSCAASPPLPGTRTNPASEGIVMEVGSCLGGPYGLFLYVWQRACPASQLALNAVLCPPGARNYGFVVAAPSRGLTPERFREAVDLSMAAFKGTGQDYWPKGTAFVDVPIGPPVTRVGEDWKPATTVVSTHRVTFRWPVINDVSILGDSGAPGVFGPTTLGGAHHTWPTALGHVSAHDGPGSSALIHSAGTGCFTVAGFPTASKPDPEGLLVDFRDSANPRIETAPASHLAPRCP